MRALLSALAALSLAAVPGIASAGTDKETPGAPCVPGGGLGTNNPCNGNNGNPSPEGNANEKIVKDNHPDPFTISRPPGRGAFINQVGDHDVATITQTANTQYARIDQSGDGNHAAIAQSGTAAHYAAAQQAGSFNELSLAQSGPSVQVALVQQQGNFNEMTLSQQGGLLTSGVAAVQLGDDNSMSLSQSGGNNMARLTQNGSGDAMTVTQTGGNNQLTWTQTGDNLSNLNISQDGGRALAITQSR